MTEEAYVHSVSRVVHASPETLFELIADPAKQPQWDGNDNLGSAKPGQRVHHVDDMFIMTLARGVERENHVVEFIENQLIAWLPASPGEPPAGHLWRWELKDLGDGTTEVQHTYDWSNLHDEVRLKRARATNASSLMSSVERLATLAESS